MISPVLRQRLAVEACHAFVREAYRHELRTLHPDDSIIVYADTFRKYFPMFAAMNDEVLEPDYFPDGLPDG